jgi:hypothetical protein
MEISSVLNPQNIIGNRQGTAEQFQNFMTGGNGSLGSSIVNSTSSNKIVPFERGGVRPITPNFNSIISNISTKTDTVLDTNIKNQENKVQGIVNNIQNVFQTTLQNFTKGYQQKLKSIEESKPSGILEKFFGLYNNVTGFIQFFGDRKNLNKISSSLKGLRGLFEDSFETAKLIRKTINKIVKQLSSLPVASPSGGGGFNLDIKVPGSPLKNAAGKVLGGGRGKMLALGAGALGTGMLAGGAINALTGSEDIQPAAVQQSIPENLADSLSSIVDRFVNAIDELIKGASQKPKTTPSTSGGGGGGGGSPGGKKSGGGDMGPIASGSADEKIAAYTSALEGTEGQNAADAFQVMLNRTAQNHSGYGGLGEQVMARGQFTPIAAAIYGTSGDNAANRAYGHIAPMLGKTPEERKAKLRQIVETEGLQGLDKLFNKNLAGNANAVLADFKSGGPLSQAAVQGVKGRAYFKGQDDLPNKRPEDFYRGTKGNYFHGNSSGKIGYLEPTTASATTLATPGVSAAPAQTQANQAKAAAISQPVNTKSNITTLSMPPQVSSAGGAPQGGGGGGGGVSAPPPPSGGSPSVPFLPAGNVDNFLVLYSKMVYNIVDG